MEKGDPDEKLREKIFEKTYETMERAAPPDEPKAEEPKAEEPKAEEPKAEEPKAEEPKPEEPKAEEPKPEEPKPEEPKAEGLPPPDEDDKARKLAEWKAMKKEEAASKAPDVEEAPVEAAAKAGGELKVVGGVIEVHEDGSRRHCPKCGNDKPYMIKEFVDKAKIINPYPVIYGKKYKCGQCGAEWRYVF
ncbi:MAG: hypothetical protein ACTSU5_12960 [Promethearchaeota archaeon]